MREIYLNDIAHGRSGDKGDTSNICVFARRPEYYKIIEREVTPERLHAYFGDMVKGEIVRYDLPSLGGFNFVMRHECAGRRRYHEPAAGQPRQIHGQCDHASESSGGG